MPISASGARRSAAPVSGPAAADPLAGLVQLPGVDAAVLTARDAVDRLLAHRVLRRQSAGVTAESALRGARASAVLDGSTVELSELRAGGAIEDPVARGALRLSAGLGGLVDTWERAPLQVLARMHVLAAAGQVPAERLGRPSSGGPDGTRRLDALAHIVAGGSAAPAVLVASIVHAELHALAPFGWGDGLVARAAARLTMISRGLDPKAVSVPEVGYLERHADHGAALAAYRTGTAGGVAAWLRHCCAAVELGAREGRAICEAVQRG